MEVLKVILSVLPGYLLGSLNSSLLVGMLWKKDIRQDGSGNAGLTNALRVLGKGAALLTAVGDVLKGVLSCVAGYKLMGETGAILAGGAAVAGHNWPLYFGFRGGKGALTSISVIFYLDWKLGLMLASVFIVVVLLTRYVSLGSITGALMLPVLTVLLGKDILFIVFSLLLATLVIARHKSNIKRLLHGQELKLVFRKMR